MKHFSPPILFAPAIGFDVNIVDQSTKDHATDDSKETSQQDDTVARAAWSWRWDHRDFILIQSDGNFAVSEGYRYLGRLEIVLTTDYRCNIFRWTTDETEYVATEYENIPSSQGMAYWIILNCSLEVSVATLPRKTLAHVLFITVFVEVFLHNMAKH